MVAYLFERFPKFSQTFCYREVAELFRQGERPAIFSLRAPESGPTQDWDPAIIQRVEYLAEGDVFARAADAAAKSLGRDARATLREWRGKPDSLRLHQAVYLGAKLRALGVTHLHTHFAGMGARTAYWLQKFYDIPWSVTVHANDIFAPRPYEIGLPQMMASARTVVTVSDYAANLLREKFPETRFVRVYNGIDLADFNASSFAAPARLVFVGRLIGKKGVDVLLDALRQLRTLPFAAQIVGDGPLRAELEAQLQRNELTGAVTFTGEKPQAEIRALLATASVFVLPARVDSNGAMDNLPTVIMEAMASSLPVVSTTVAGIPEMVVSNETGYLVPPDDPVALAGAIEKLLRDPETARAMGKHGRARAAQLFALEKNVAALRKVFA